MKFVAKDEAMHTGTIVAVSIFTTASFRSMPEYGEQYGRLLLLSTIKNLQGFARSPHSSLDSSDYVYRNDSKPPQTALTPQEGGLRFRTRTRSLESIYLEEQASPAVFSC